MPVEPTSSRSLSTRISSGIVSAAVGGMVAELLNIVLLRNRPEEGVDVEDVVAAGLGILLGILVAVFFGEAGLPKKTSFVVQGAVIGTMSGAVVSTVLGSVLIGLRLATPHAQGAIIALCTAGGLLVGPFVGRIMAGGRMNLREIAITIGFFALVCTALMRFLRQ